MSKSEKEPNKQLKECVLSWIDRLSTHFNQPQDEEQIKIFLHALRVNTVWQVNKAFERCLNECQFMPKLADVHQRMPEQDMNAAFANKKTTEMMQDINAYYNGQAETWETEEHPGSIYRWYGKNGDRVMLLSVRRA